MNLKNTFNLPPGISPIRMVQLPQPSTMCRPTLVRPPAPQPNRPILLLQRSQHLSVCCHWINLFIPHLRNHRRPWRYPTLHIKHSCSRRWVRRHQALPLHIQQLYRRRWRRCHPALRLRIQQLCNRRWLPYHHALRLNIQQLSSRRLVIHHQARPERQRKWQEDGEGEQNERRKKMEIRVFRKDPTNL